MTPIEQAIRSEIHSVEIIEQHTLTEDEKEFLVYTITSFAADSIYKYINGSIKHGDGFLTDVDHLHESLNEVKDLLFYISAAIQKQSNYDTRNGNNNATPTNINTTPGS